MWLGGVMALGPALPALAHAQIEKSMPAAEAVLYKSPAVIEAWFSEELALHGSVMRLYNAGNQQLAVGGVDLKDTSHQTMKIVPPYLHAGTYMVHWHAIAADDNGVTDNTFHFSIAGTSVAPGGLLVDVFRFLRGM